jgi:hypothetical protein
MAKIDLKKSNLDMLYQYMLFLFLKCTDRIGHYFKLAVIN